MAIQTDSIIKYGEIRDLVLSKILSIVKNVGSYTADVPAEMKTDFTQTKTDRKASVVVRIDNNTVIPVVTQQTIIDQFNNYLTEKGVSTAENTVMTATSLLNFYNVAAAFVTTKIVMVTSYLTSTVIPMYKATTSASEWPTVPVINVVDPTASPTVIDNTNVKNATQFLEMFDRSRLSAQMIAYTYNYTCSSCSSSSSSSSSFIAYMALE